MSPLILLIEDNPGDSALVTEAIKEIRADIRIEIAADGSLGLKSLHDRALRNELPDLVICNFNLPRLTGAQVLSAVRKDPQFARIPFIMLTSSERDCDRQACSGAKAYLIKGTGWDDTRAIARQIVDSLVGTDDVELISARE